VVDDVDDDFGDGDEDDVDDDKGTDEDAADGCSFLTDSSGFWDSRRQNSGSDDNGTG